MKKVIIRISLEPVSLKINSEPVILQLLRIGLNREVMLLRQNINIIINKNINDRRRDRRKFDCEKIATEMNRKTNKKYMAKQLTVL